MQNIIKLLAILAFLIFGQTDSHSFYGENRTKKHQTFDTIRPNYSFHKNAACNSIMNKYTYRFGVFISQYYNISSFIPFDFNKDGAMDTIVILSPIVSTPMTDAFNKCNDSKKQEDRLLVFIGNYKKKSFVYKIYKSVVSNEVSVAWQGWEDLIKEKDGFSLVATKGQGCIFEYRIYFKLVNKFLYLNKIDMSFYCPNMKYNEKTYKFDNKNLKMENYKRNIIDSLKLLNNW